MTAWLGFLRACGGVMENVCRWYGDLPGWGCQFFRMRTTVEVRRRLRPDWAWPYANHRGVVACQALHQVCLVSRSQQHG